MAFTVTKAAESTSDGRAMTVFTVAGTSVGASSEFEIDNIPEIGSIVLFQAELVSGTGTTLQPEIGSVTSWTDDTDDEVDVVDTALAWHNIHTTTHYYAPGNSLFVRPVPDAGSDNVVAFKVGIVSGWSK